MRPLLVGEANPYYVEGDDPNRYALYPLPERASGHRLCVKIMGFTDSRRGMQEYLSSFDRVNVCAGKWSMKEARGAAQGIRLGAGHERVVLCGQKVCIAFGIPYEPLLLFVDEQRRSDLPPVRFLILPHPSGLCRFWNQPEAFERARAFLLKHGVINKAHFATGCGPRAE
jgi:hypothetical protein